MSLTTELRQYGEIAAEQGKLALTGLRTGALAAVGAGDLIAVRVTEQGKALATRASELTTVRIGPGEVRGYLQNASGVYADLSKRGAEVVHEFRKDPRVQSVILRAERTVDVVEDSLEDLLEEVADDTATATKKAEAAVAEGAERTRSTVRKAAARNTNARKSTATTPPARKAPARTSTATTSPDRKAPARTSTATTPPAGKAPARTSTATTSPDRKAPARKRAPRKAAATS